MSAGQGGTDAGDPGTGLTDEETQLGLQNITRMSLTGQAMGTLTGGAFMVKILVEFGAPLYVFGLLSALPALAGAVQVPAAYFTEKYRARKRIAFLGFGLTRVFVLSLAVIPLFVAGELGISAASVVLFVGAAYVVSSNYADPGAPSGNGTTAPVLHPDGGLVMVGVVGLFVLIMAVAGLILYRANFDEE